MVLTTPRRIDEICHLLHLVHLNVGRQTAHQTVSIKIGAQ